MIKRILAVAVLVGVGAPQTVAAQGLGFGVFGGSLGLGGEAAVGVTDRIVLRGGFGVFSFEPTVDVSDLSVELDMPSSYHAGIDLYLNGSMRLSGGVLLRIDDPKLSGTFTEPQEIGGTEFSPAEIGTLTGVLDAKDQAPYLLIGFGKHIDPGVGLFLDLGVAFVGEPDVRLGAQGGSLSPDAEPLKSALEREAQEIEDDLQGYLKYFPFISLGLRFGVS